MRRPCYRWRLGLLCWLLCASRFVAGSSPAADPDRDESAEKRRADPRGGDYVEWNGHYYRVVVGQTTFTSASTAAGSATHMGMQGYLATVTSEEEHDLLGGLLSGASTGCYILGGSDSTTEQVWRWIGGPENGRAFYVGHRNNPRCLGFCKWRSNTPHNNGGDNDHMCVDNTNGNTSWRDIGATDTVAGYIVEFSDPNDDAEFAEALTELSTGTLTTEFLDGTPNHRLTPPDPDSPNTASVPAAAVDIRFVSWQMLNSGGSVESTLSVVGDADAGGFSFGPTPLAGTRGEAIEFSASYFGESVFAARWRLGTFPASESNRLIEFTRADFTVPVNTLKWNVFLYDWPTNGFSDGRQLRLEIAVEAVDPEFTGAFTKTSQTIVASDGNWSMVRHRFQGTNPVSLHDDGRYFVPQLDVTLLSWCVEYNHDTNMNGQGQPPSVFDMAYQVPAVGQTLDRLYFTMPSFRGILHVDPMTEYVMVQVDPPSDGGGDGVGGDGVDGDGDGDGVDGDGDGVDGDGDGVDGGGDGDGSDEGADLSALGALAVLPVIACGAGGAVAAFFFVRRKQKRKQRGKLAGGNATIVVGGDEDSDDYDEERGWNDPDEEDDQSEYSSSEDESVDNFEKGTKMVPMPMTNYNNSKNQTDAGTADSGKTKNQSVAFEASTSTSTMSAEDQQSSASTLSTASLLTCTADSSKTSRLEDTPYRELEWEDLEIDESAPLGRGSFGKVFKGKWRGTEVAVKMFDPAAAEVFASIQLADELRKEAQMMQRVGNHPHVVHFVGAITRGEKWCIVTQLAPNGSLATLLRNHHIKLPHLRLMKMARDVASAMVHLHKEKVVHRDLACRNILVGDNYHVYVSDFGLSRIAETDQVNVTASNIGPIRWMAPEAIAERQYSEASDVFSFGVTLWEMLSREEPWSGIDAAKVVLLVVGQKQRLALSLDWPKPLRKLIAWCFEENPRKRPTFARILSVLDHYIAGLRHKRPGENKSENEHAAESGKGKEKNKVRNEKKRKERKQKAQESELESAVALPSDMQEYVAKG